MTMLEKVAPRQPQHEENKSALRNYLGHLNAAYAGDGCVTIEGQEYRIVGVHREGRPCSESASMELRCGVTEDLENRHSFKKFRKSGQDEFVIEIDDTKHTFSLLAVGSRSARKPSATKFTPDKIR